MAGNGLNGHAADPAVLAEAKIIRQPAPDPELVERVEYHDAIQIVDCNGVKQDARTLASRLQYMSISAQTVHADDFLNSHPSVAPPMHVSTTFRYSRDPEDLNPGVNISVSLPPLLFVHLLLHLLLLLLVDSFLPLYHSSTVPLITVRTPGLSLEKAYFRPWRTRIINSGSTP